MIPPRAIAYASGLALLLFALIGVLLVAIAIAISSGRQIWLRRRHARQDLSPDLRRRLARARLIDGASRSRSAAPGRKPAGVPESGKRRPVNSSGG